MVRLCHSSGGPGRSCQASRTKSTMQGPSEVALARKYLWPGLWDGTMAWKEDDMLASGLKWKTEPRTTVHAHKCWSKNLFHTNDALVLRWPRILLYVYPRVQQSCFIMLCKQSWGGGEAAQSRIPVTAIGRSYTLFPVSLWKTCFAWETAFRRVLELLQFTAAGRASVG